MCGVARVGVETEAAATEVEVEAGVHPGGWAWWGGQW